MQKNVIFIFLKKIPIKIRTKNIYYYFRHFFHFLLCYFKKKIKKVKVGLLTFFIIKMIKINT
jgi:hypothetical protein